MNVFCKLEQALEHRSITNLLSLALMLSNHLLRTVNVTAATYLSVGNNTQYGVLLVFGAKRVTDKSLRD